MINTNPLVDGTADILVERRRLRRSVFLWRLLAIGILLFAIFLGTAPYVSQDGNLARFGVREPHIARIDISGVIVDDQAQVDMIREIVDADEVKGVIIDIDSPGGTVVGGEVLYNALRALAEKKPLTALINTLGTSAGYIAAISSDHIVAHRNSITGSIGVIVQYAELGGLADKIGIKFKSFRSGALKAVPSPFEPTSDEAAEMMDGIVADSMSWFTGLVAERRNLDGETLAFVSDGRILTGAQALEKNLIDALGDENEARRWLEEDRAVESDLPVIDWEPVRPGVPWFLRYVEGAKVMEFLGLAEPLERLALSGLLAVWHPHSAENGR